MFPQVLLDGVNPLIALNQINSEVFTVCHCILSQIFFPFLWSMEQTAVSLHGRKCAILLTRLFLPLTD